SVAGIRNSLGSWYDRHIEPGLAQAAHITEDVLKTVGDIFVKTVTLPWAVAQYIADPSWDNLSNLLDHVSAALTVAVVVLTVAGSVFTGGAFAAAVPEIIAGLKIANTAVDAAKLGVDGYRKVGLHENQDVTWADLGFEAFGVATEGVDAARFTHSV